MRLPLLPDADPRPSRGARRPPLAGAGASAPALEARARHARHALLEQQGPAPRACDVAARFGFRSPREASTSPRLATPSRVVARKRSRNPAPFIASTSSSLPRATLLGRRRRVLASAFGHLVVDSKPTRWTARPTSPPRTGAYGVSSASTRSGRPARRRRPSRVAYAFRGVRTNPVAERFDPPTPIVSQRAARRCRRDARPASIRHGAPIVSCARLSWPKAVCSYPTYGGYPHKPPSAA